MSGSIEERLLQAIQSDDIKSFNKLMKEAQCGRYRLGRFPVLSLMYLYSSRRIISAYEDKFIRILAWKELREPAEVARLFSKKAGKCLRLYLSETVSPLEMLLILDRTKKIKALFPSVKPPEAVRLRLQAIYSVKYSLDINYSDGGIVIPRRPLSYGQKRGIIAACLGAAAAVAIAIATPITVVALSPKLAEGEVTRLSQIDFGSQNTYTLVKNIAIPKSYSAKAINCNIIGGGNKLVLKKGASLGVLNGKMSDVVFQTTGSPIFTALTGNAVLSDVTVNVNASAKVKTDSAFIAIENYGVLDGVTLNVSGTLSAVADKNSAADELIFGGMVVSNSYSYTPLLQTVDGIIQNCTVNYTNFKIKGELAANASFGGIVGVNSGVVRDCEVTGSVSADVFDLAGVCYVNNYLISGAVNNADLSQTAQTAEWYPIVGGIAIESSYTVENCINSGDISVYGQGTAICGGIVARTYSQINYCLSSGNISITAPDVYVGGIFGRSEVKTANMSILRGSAYRCISSGNISVAVRTEEPSCIGGIGGLIQERKVNIIDNSGNVIEEQYYGGSVTDCIFMGSFGESYNYTGNIIGVCGAEVYELNSYASDGIERANFEGNYYLENGQSSFGAVVTFEEEFLQVNGKGATAATENEILQTEAYNEILEKLGK